MTFIHPSDARWGEALAGSPHDVYATPGYVLAEAGVLDGEASGFLMVEDDRILLVPLIVRLVSTSGPGCEGVTDAISPYGYPGIVMNEPGRIAPGFVDRCFARLLDAARSRGIVSIFMRLHPWLNADIPELTEDVEFTQHGATVAIDLSGPEAEIWSVMRKGHTNAINKAIRAGFEVEIVAPADGFDDLTLVYRETLERLGQRSRTERDMDRLRRVAALDATRVAMARLDGEVAGAYLFFEHDGIVQMHLGGTRSGFMRPSPSHLLIHAVALWAKARGNSTVHLGGGVGGSTSDSLFTFKSGFSRTRHPFRTVRLVSDSSHYERLVEARADVLGAPREVVAKSKFFPAYRAGLDDLDPGDACHGPQGEGSRA